MLTGKVGPTGLPKRGLPGETEGGPMQDAGGVFPFWRVPEIRYKWVLPCRDGGFRNVKKRLKSMGQTNRAGGFFRVGRGLDNRREAETCMQESLTGDGSGWCARRDAPVYGQG